jgi:hypothetical protein
VAQKAATFARFDATMPARERLWAAVLQMVERFVLDPTIVGRSCE